MLSACFPHHSRVVASFCALALSLAAVGTFQCASVPRGGVVSGVDSANSGGDQLLETAPEDNESPAECISYPDLAQPQWFHKAVMYEIFVRSFQDSDGDGIGDLQGIIQRLDYLNDGDPKTETDLGITLLWLMPISPSPSYHGYDVTDYRSVNPDYGTAEDLKTLVEEADKRGIKILLDLVMNHSSDQHPWFVDSAQSTSTRRDWYLWAETAHNWPRPWGDKHSTWHKSGDQWYYGIFWSGMPDLNYTVQIGRAHV